MKFPVKSTETKRHNGWIELTLNFDKPSLRDRILYRLRRLVYGYPYRREYVVQNGQRINVKDLPPSDEGGYIVPDICDIGLFGVRPRIFRTLGRLFKSDTLLLHGIKRTYPHDAIMKAIKRSES